MTITEARQKRAALVAQMRTLVATADGRAMTADEARQWDDLDLQQGRLAETIAALDPEHAPARIYVRDRTGLDALEQELSQSQGTSAARQQGERDHPTPREERVLQPTESVRSYLLRSGAKVDPEIATLGIGTYLRAMVLGPRNALERRALAEGSDSAGGFTVPDILSAELIDRMRARLITAKLGARTVPLTSDNLSIARLATDPVAAWRLENAPVAESDPTFEALKFVPRSLAVLVKASVEVLQDSLNIETALTNAFAGSMAVEVDRVALEGSGVAPEPRGIKNTAGVNELAAVGAITSYDPLIDLMALLWADNVPQITGIVMNPAQAATLAKLKEATTNAPLAPPAALAGIPREMTTACGAGSIYLGNWAELWLGVRTALRIEVLKERYMENLQYGFVCWTRVDVQLAHAASFGRGLGVTGTMAAKGEEAEAPRRRG
jgi:HK97 family phage major capsid protein